MNRVKTIFQGKSLVVERSDHPEHCFHRDPESERTEYITVNFLERGGFEMMQGKEWWTFSRRDVLVSTPGLKRRYRHFHACPDDVCLTITFTPQVLEDALGQLPGNIPPPKVQAGPAPDFAYRWIMHAVNSACPLEIESASFHCAAALGPHRWERMPQLSGVGAHARRIREACMDMAVRLEESHSLTSLAAEAGMSPFHFARVFSELVGEPPHRYLVRIRMRQAAKLLRLGASVTEAAVKSGFPNINHFSRTFHRRYGVPPSDYAS